MSLPWVALNDKLIAGIAACNQVTNEHFTKILHYSHKKALGSAQEQDEALQMLKSLESELTVDKAAFNLAVKAIVFIFRRSLLFIQSLTTLATDLNDTLKLAEEKTDIFVKLWQTVTKEMLCQLNLETELQDVWWNLEVQLASKDQQKGKEPLGKLRLQTADKKVHSLEMDLEELQGLYETMESIQSELDLLRKATS